METKILELQKESPCVGVCTTSGETSDLNFLSELQAQFYNRLAQDIISCYVKMGTIIPGVIGVKDILNTAYIGKKYLNKLRDRCASFRYVYGFVNGMTYVEDLPLSLEQALSKASNPDLVKSILLQLFVSLDMASVEGVSNFPLEIGCRLVDPQSFVPMVIENQLKYCPTFGVIPVWMSFETCLVGQGANLIAEKTRLYEYLRNLTGRYFPQATLPEFMEVPVMVVTQPQGRVYPLMVSSVSETKVEDKIDRRNIERRAELLYQYLRSPRRTSLETLVTLPVLQEYALMLNEFPEKNTELYRKISVLESKALTVPRAQLEAFFLKVSLACDKLTLPLSGDIYDYRNSLRTICFLRTADGLYQRFTPILGKKYRSLEKELEEARKRRDSIRASLVDPPLPNNPETRVYNGVEAVLLGYLPVDNMNKLETWFEATSEAERKVYLVAVHRELIITSDPVLLL
ncbi:MAG: hypothetical protein ACYCQJ_14695 [Nitrososphaerales archaeon]